MYLKKDFWKKIVDNFPDDMELDKNLLTYFEDINDLEDIISKLN